MDGRSRSLGKIFYCFLRSRCLLTYLYIQVFGISRACLVFFSLFPTYFATGKCMETDQIPRCAPFFQGSVIAPMRPGFLPCLSIGRVIPLAEASN